MKKYLLWAITIVAFSIIITRSAVASCDTSQTGKQNISIPPIMISTDVKPGTVIWDSGYLPPPSGGFSTYCTTSGSWGTRIPSGAKAVSGYSHVYKTSVPGVGIKIGFDNTNGHGDPINNPSRLVTYTINDVQAKMGYSKALYTHVQLIATGTVGSGALTFSKPYVEVFYEEDTVAKLNINDSSVNPVSHSCSVDGGSSVNVDLGHHQLPEFTGVNYKTASVNVPISLNCDKGAVITATLQAEQDPDTDKDSIKLSPGGASGVSVLLKDKNNARVPLNSSFVVDTTTSDGQYLFNWTASYLQTLSAVTPGKANATATLQLTYN